MGDVGTSKPSGRSLLSCLEWRAKETPDSPCFQQPNKDFSEVKSYSYDQVLQMVDNLASWLIEKIGDAPSQSVVAYFGAADPRYVLMPLAAKRADFLALYLGLQNSFDANAHLCKETSARAILYSDGIDTSVLPTDENLKAFCIPELDELLDLKANKPLPEVDHEHGSFLCLHSSGSTGLPKPIYIASECLSAILSQMEVPDFEGYPVQNKVFRKATLLYFGIPLYHMSGFVVGTRYALFYGVPVLYMPRDRKPGKDLLVEAIEKTNIDACLNPPGLFDEFIEDEAAMEKLKKLKFMASGGGILPHDACEHINKIVPIQAVFGSTEVTDFIPIVHTKEREEWEYFHINPEYNNIEWRAVEEGDEFKELVIKRDPKLEHLQGVFYNFPDRDEFSYGDLFSPHPSKKNYWRYESRTDDQISFANASTLNPLPIEDELVQDENIKHAMIVGDGRPFPILVIQPTDEAYSNIGGPDEIREKIWDTISQANKNARANGQIASKRHVIVTDKDSPLVTTAKTTVSKKASVKQLEDEIEGVYKNATDEDHRDLSKRIDE